MSTSAPSHPEDAPDVAETIEIGFLRGDPVSVERRGAGAGGYAHGAE